MNTLIYTFRTFKGLDLLNSSSAKVVVLGKLKKDILTLRNTLKKERPGWVIGLANAKQSIMESRAVNKFNNGVINKEGKKEYPLQTTDILGLPISKKFTTSFCNWGMYKTSEILEELKLDIPHTFIHVAEDDIQNVIENLLI